MNTGQVLGLLAAVIKRIKKSLLYGGLSNIDF